MLLWTGSGSICIIDQTVFQWEVWSRCNSTVTFSITPLTQQSQTTCSARARVCGFMLTIRAEDNDREQTVHPDREKSPSSPIPKACGASACSSVLCCDPRQCVRCVRYVHVAAVPINPKTTKQVSSKQWGRNVKELGLRGWNRIHLSECSPEHTAWVSVQSHSQTRACVLLNASVLGVGVGLQWADQWDLTAVSHITLPLSPRSIETSLSLSPQLPVSGASCWITRTMLQPPGSARRTDSKV